MRALRIFRNLAALFIFAAAMLVARPGLANTPKDTCVSDSSTVGSNCVLNSDGTCNSSNCKAGQACNNSKCADFDYCQKHCCFFCK